MAAGTARAWRGRYEKGARWPMMTEVPGAASGSAWGRGDPLQSHLLPGLGPHLLCASGTLGALPGVAGTRTESPKPSSTSLGSACSPSGCLQEGHQGPLPPQKLLVGAHLRNGPLGQHHDAVGLGQHVVRVGHEDPRLGREGGVTLLGSASLWKSKREGGHPQAHSGVHTLLLSCPLSGRHPRRDAEGPPAIWGHWAHWKLAQDRAQWGGAQLTMGSCHSNQVGIPRRPSCAENTLSDVAQQGGPRWSLGFPKADGWLARSGDGPPLPSVTRKGWITHHKPGSSALTRIQSAAFYGMPVTSAPSRRREISSSLTRDAHTEGRWA